MGCVDKQLETADQHFRPLTLWNGGVDHINDFLWQINTCGMQQNWHLRLNGAHGRSHSAPIHPRHQIVKQDSMNQVIFKENQTGWPVLRRQYLIPGHLQ
jgi:hypothetical protein